MKRVVALFAGVVLTAASISTVQTASSTVQTRRRPPRQTRPRSPGTSPRSCSTSAHLPSRRRSGADVAALLRAGAALGAGHQEQGRVARDAAVGRGHARDAADAQRHQPLGAADQDHRAWVDAGAPKGNAADMPPTPTFTTGWTYGKSPTTSSRCRSSSTFPPKASSASRCSTRRCR